MDYRDEYAVYLDEYYGKGRSQRDIIWNRQKARDDTRTIEEIVAEMTDNYWY